MRIFIVFLWVTLGLSASAFAGNILSVDVQRDAELLTLDIGAMDSYKSFFLDNPNRLVVDVPLTQVPKVVLDNYRGSLIGNVRAGQFNQQTVRIVFELNAPVTLVSKTLEAGTLRIRITTSSKPTTSKVVTKPKPSEIPLIVIDAGHGGQDPGATGPRGTLEKDVTLTFARALQFELQKSGKYRVMLTRNDDRFIVLRERVAIAQRAKASVFISIHADSAPRDDARGLSVYTVSEKASDAEAESLAARENKVDVLSGMDLSHERADVADILISLAQRDTKNQSSLLADLFVRELDKRVRMLNNSHRYAGFAVLKAPDIPSVLIETGFLSHPEEEKLLKTKAYREKLVSGMVSALNAYFAMKGTAAP